MTWSGKTILVSIHDVTPETLPQVRSLADAMAAQGLPPALLLVCPGTGWNERTLAALKDFVERGHTLAGHGWRHCISGYGGLYHRLHAALVSRDVAEHLERDADGIAELIQRSHDWFEAHDLASPSLYVPPAWAMGSVDLKRLRDLPYRWYETLSGMYDAERGEWQRWPLVGFEADTACRAVILRGSNRLNRRLAEVRDCPVRVALHPYDLSYRLRADIERLFTAGPNCMTWHDIETQGNQ